MFFSRPAGTKFEDRGDPAANDYYSGNLTVDGAWHDLDLSAIIGSNKALVLLRAIVWDAGVGGQHIKFRTKGNSNDVNVAKCTCQQADQQNLNDCWVVTDSDGIIEYNMSAALDGAYITVGGQWLL